MLVVRHPSHMVAPWSPSSSSQELGIGRFLEAAVVLCAVSSSESECCELLYVSELRVVLCKFSGSEGGGVNFGVPGGGSGGCGFPARFTCVLQEGCSCCYVSCVASVVARSVRAVVAWLAVDSLAVVFSVWRIVASKFMCVLLVIFGAFWCVFAAVPTLLLGLSRCSVCRVASLVERCDTCFPRAMLCSFLVVVALPSGLRCIARLPCVLVRHAVDLTGAFWQDFLELYLGGSGEVLPRPACVASTEVLPRSVLCSLRATVVLLLCCRYEEFVVGRRVNEAFGWPDAIVILVVPCLCIAFLSRPTFPSRLRVTPSQRVTIVFYGFGRLTSVKVADVSVRPVGLSRHPYGTRWLKALAGDPSLLSSFPSLLLLLRQCSASLSSPLSVSGEEEGRARVLGVIAFIASPCSPPPCGGVCGLWAAPDWSIPLVCLSIVVATPEEASTRSDAIFSRHASPSRVATRFLCRDKVVVATCLPIAIGLSRCPYSSQWFWLSRACLGCPAALSRVRACLVLVGLVMGYKSVVSAWFCCATPPFVRCSALEGLSHSEVVSISWDPHPHEPVKGVLQAMSMLEFMAYSLVPVHGGIGVCGFPTSWHVEACFRDVLDSVGLWGSLLCAMTLAGGRGIALF
ncbi:hypothetical protein Taro_043402 [Colocasia esculenta]|uniref:Uncharacterized protein n=1 Tax=Colocasia esculenta TaxID=4460 RepID=A0A843WYV0_COLES|nr:hypothetical protein [Colocasia esculenta]